MVKSEKCMGVSQLLGARARAAPKVYAYGGCISELATRIDLHLYNLRTLSTGIHLSVMLNNLWHRRPKPVLSQFFNILSAICP